MYDSSYRPNFDLGKRNEIYHYSVKEHPKIGQLQRSRNVRSSWFGRETFVPAVAIDFVLPIYQILVYG